MTAIYWQATITLTVFAGFFIGYFSFRSFRHAIMIGLPITGFWTLWTLGLSSWFIGYVLAGPLRIHQLSTIGVVSAFCATITYLLEQLTRENIAKSCLIHRANEQNQLLKREMQALRKSFHELQETIPEAPSFGSAMGPSPQPISGSKEHRKELLHFIKQSKDRLVILSGWVTEHACDEKLIEALKEALDRGVKAYFGWGYKLKKELGKNTLPNKGEEYLKDLRKQYPGRAFLVNFENHAKLLLTSDKCIIGSFNWLSNTSSYNEEISIVIKEKNYIEGLWRTTYALLKEKMG